VPGLKVGPHSVTAVYAGDSKYAGNSNATEFTVKPANTTTDAVSVMDLGNGTVIVHVPENATGNVSITIANQTVVQNITGGSAVFNLINTTNATPGTYGITVKYSGDENHTAVDVGSIIVIPKYQTPISISVASIVQAGDVAVITVNVPSNATGNITLDIKGQMFTEKIENGSAVFNIPDLKVGFKTVVAEYAGDDNYTANYTISDFTVSKRPSFVNLTATPTDVGGQATITVVVPEAATGIVVIQIDDNKYAVDINNGTGTLHVVIDTTGEHSVDATYIGDDQFLESHNHTDVNVFRLDSEINITVSDITLGEKVIVK